MVHRCAALLLLLLTVGGWSMAEPLSSIATIRGLDADQRTQRLPVKLEAVVTYYNDAWGVLFVNDEKDGICVGIPDGFRGRNLKPGMKVQVEGVAGAGEFLPVVEPFSILERGTVDLPAARQVKGEQLFEPALDAAFIEVQAIVKSTWFSSASLVVDLQIDGWMVKALVPQSETMKQLPWQLVERKVRVRGVAGTHFNDQRQMSGRILFVPGLEFFEVQEESRTEQEPPLLPVEGLLRVGSPLRQHVRVQGVATHVMPGRGLYLRGEGGSLFVQTAQPLEVQRGDQVEAEGFPQVTPFRPSLSATNVKKTGTAKLPAPVPFRASQTRNSREQCELVSLDADFIELMHSREGEVLVCRAEGQVFEAVLGAARPVEELVPGMKLHLAGICEFSTTRPLEIPRNATGFRLQLRGPEDVIVRARGPWWTERRALWLLGSLGLLALTIGAWAITLQVMVRRQSSVIATQAQQQATMEERQRIARDLHDTLEQELVGVQMLLDNTAKRLTDGPEQAEQPLMLARRLLRRARDESRSTIRELRSVALEQRGLAAALEEILRPLATVGGAAFEMTVEGTPARLAGTTETHLLRIAQEAVANAAHHGGPKLITLSLEYEPVCITLSVQDDGCGFLTETSAPGHFGLQGMRERADKIAAQLTIKSSLGYGTLVRVRVPVAEKG